MESGSLLTLLIIDNHEYFTSIKKLIVMKLDQFVSNDFSIKIIFSEGFWGQFFFHFKMILTFVFLEVKKCIYFLFKNAKKT